MALLENIDFAIMNRVNDLASRYGFKPYDFVTTLRSVDENELNPPKSGMHALNYEYTFQDHEAGKRRFDTMLKTIGLDTEGSSKLVGTHKDIIDSLDHALSIAPRTPKRA